MMPDVGPEQDRPPRSKAKQNGGAPKGPGATQEDKKYPPTLERLRDNVEGLYGGLGMLVMTLADPEVGALVMAQSEPISRAWADLAETSPATRRFLERVTTGGNAGQLIAMHMAIIVPVLAKYGVLPVPEPMRVQFMAPVMPEGWSPHEN